jgi:type I restriction enzyme S subunit
MLHDLLTRGLDDNGELRDPLAHPERFKESPLGKIPCQWETEILDTLVESAVDGPFGSNAFE